MDAIADQAGKILDDLYIMWFFRQLEQKTNESRRKKRRKPFLGMLVYQYNANLDNWPVAPYQSELNFLVERGYLSKDDQNGNALYYLTQSGVERYTFRDL